MAAGVPIGELVCVARPPGWGAFIRPAKNPNAANSIEAANTPTIQGHGEVADSSLAAVGVPQRWQNRAPALKGAEQLVQAVKVSGAAQLLQNLPDADLPHFGHVVAVIDRPGSKSKGRGNNNTGVHSLAVLSPNELDPKTKIQAIEVVRLPHEAETV